MMRRLLQSALFIITLLLTMPFALAWLLLLFVEDMTGRH